MSQYVSKYVVCPFYRKHSDNRICCEGTDDDNTINLVFGDSKRLKEYGLSFCNDSKCYKGCMVYQMLNQKYPDTYKKES